MSKEFSIFVATMLQLNDIQKSYGSHHIFNIDNLLLGKGIYLLKGANGAGKSTLLKLMAGMIPFKGDVIINKEVSLKKNQVAYRHLLNNAEAEPLYPSFLTGNELVDFVCRIKVTNADQVAELKSILGIGDYLKNPTGSYSSGMLKKFSLLLAFCGRPEWILLDEPLTTLDAISQKALCALITQQHSDKNISFVITSHHDIENNDLHFDKTFLLENKCIKEISDLR